jgi:hypothetical protein
MHLAAFCGLTNRIFRLSPGVFYLALCLLNNAFYLKLCIACYLARFALGASCYFVDSSLHSILIHSSTSVDLTLIDLIKVLEYYSSSSHS